MAGQYDIVNTVGLDLNPALEQYNKFARSLPSINAKVNLPLGAISRQASDFEKSLGAAQSRVAAFGLAAGSVYAISRAFDELVKSTIEVQKDLTNINVILNLSTNQLSQFSGKLFGIANLTAQSFKDVADVALQFSRQGLGVEEVLKRTAAALTLVRIGGTDVETSIAAITTTLNTFNQVGLDAFAILNKIATVDTKFSVSGNVIAEALTRVASTAEETGVSFDRLIGMTTALQQITARGGAVIGNALKAIFTRIERPETINQLNQMGIATEDLNGKMLSADAILTNLAKSYGGLSDAQKNQVNNLAAGLFQINQFRALIGDLAKTNGIAARATQTASDATDQATRRQAALNQTLASQIQVSLNNLNQFAAKAGQITIAPALNNILKGINFSVGDGQGGEIGQQVGNGILQGLGSYLSGPGLATAGVLATKFFAQFASYGVKALTTVLQTSQIKLERQEAINTLLQNQEQIEKRILELGGGDEATQRAVLELLQQQTEALNVRAALTQKIASQTSILSPNSALTSSLPFQVSNQGGESRLVQNTKFVPPFSAANTALAAAMNREKTMGVSPNDIRIGTSNDLISPDNPLGLGVYNTKDEPLGLGQGIQRAKHSGVDPKSAGMIPNFAQGSNIPYPFNLLPKSLIPKDLITPPAVFDYNNLAPDSVRYGQPPESQKFPLLLGQGSGKNAIQLPELTESSKQLNKELSDINQNFKNIIINAPKLLGKGSIILGDAGGNGEIGPKIQDFDINKFKQTSDYDEKSSQALIRNRQIREKLAQQGQYPSPYYDANGLPVEQLQSPGYQRTQQALALQKQVAAQEQRAREIATFNEGSSSLNLGNYLTGFLPSSKYSNLKTQANKLGQNQTFNDVNTKLSNQALIGSFLAPIIAGELQQLIPTTSTAGRGTSAAVGAIGNVASYAGLGAVVGGPVGAGIGAGAGLLLELPSVIKGFTDTLPDLKANLDKLKESTTSTNEAFSGYIHTYEQLNSITSGEQKVSVGQFNQINQDSQKFLSKLPPQVRAKIQAAGGATDDIYNTASIYNTIGQQNQELNQDIIDFQKSSLPNITLEAITGRSRSTGRGQGTGALQAQRDAIQNTINPEINDLLNLQNTSGSSLQSILQSLNPSDISKIFNSKSFSGGSGISDFLKKQGFDSDKIGLFSKSISQISDSGPGGQQLLLNQFSSGAVQDRFNNAQTFIVESEKEAKQLDDLNSKLANLTVTGTDAINSFEINVVTKLSNSLTKLKLQSISNETASKIAEINSGNNPYNKTYFDYTKQNASSRNEFNASTQKATSDFTDKVGNDFYNVINEFTKGLQGTGKNKASDLSDLVENKRKELNTVLSGNFKINDDFSVKKEEKDYSPQDVEEVSNNLHSKIKELENEKNSVSSGLIPGISGFLQNYPGKTLSQALDAGKGSADATQLSSKINDIQDSKVKNNLLGLTSDTASDANTARENIDIISTGYQSLLEKLTQDSAGLKRALIDARNNLSSNLQASYRQLIDNLTILPAQFSAEQRNEKFSGGIARTFGNQSFDLKRQALISDPQQSIRLNSQAELSTETGTILSNLNTATGLGITDPNQLNYIKQQQQSKYNNLKNFVGPLSDSQQQEAVATAGNVEELTKALIDLDKATKQSQQSTKQLIESLSPFTDEQAAFRKQQNINLAGRSGNGVFGTQLSGADYQEAFLSPLRYNNNDAGKDSVTALQDFSAELKNDLGPSLLEIVKGAKNASQAFRDFGISLASSIGTKFADIGINQLLNLGANGLQDILPKAAGGLIPKFAAGGFVGMGSGMKDDVPAYLSGGEFVINKNAVKRIGKNNLDMLNGTPKFADGGQFGGTTLQPQDYINANKNLSIFPGITSDSITGGSSSANITLADAFQVNSNGTGGTDVVSPLLSDLGQSNSLDPQNKLNYGRQKYTFNRNQAYQSYQKQLNAFNLQQYLRLGQAGLGAIGSIAAAAIQSGPPTSNQDTAFQAGQGPVSASDANSFVGQGNADIFSIASEGLPANSADATAASSYLGGFSSSNYLSFVNSSLGQGFNVAGAALRGSGGSIPRFSGGGYFGGDSSSDKFKAMVMGGEYVVNPSSVNKYGTNFFKSLNDTSKYASGGSVSSSYGGDSSGGTSQIVSALNQIRDKIGGSPSGATSQSSGQSATNSQQTIHITNNISLASDGSATSSSQTNTNSPSGGNKSTQSQDKDNWTKITNQMNGLITKHLTESSRPGGLLYTNFQKKNQ